MTQKKNHRQDATPTYSVVIPMKDEEENVVDLIEELEPVMESLGKAWELICIDDGSRDGTRALLHDLARNKGYLRLIAFAGNYGQSSAFDAGFRAARGEYVITLDGDRQNDPADIPKMTTAVEGYDLVCGRRAKRRDSWFKRLTSRLANGIRGRLCRDGVQDTGCSLKVYRTSCLRNIKMYHGMHRFLPALFRIEGYRTTEVDVNHREREKGKSKYNIFNRGFKTISDMFAVMWMRRRQLRYTVDQDISQTMRP